MWGAWGKCRKQILAAYSQQNNYLKEEEKKFLLSNNRNRTAMKYIEQKFASFLKPI